MTIKDFKIGDKVKIRDDLIAHRCYGNHYFFTEEWGEKLLGTEAEVIDIVEGEPVRYGGVYYGGSYLILKTVIGIVNHVPLEFIEPQKASKGHLERGGEFCGAIGEPTKMTAVGNKPLCVGDIVELSRDGNVIKEETFVVNVAGQKCVKGCSYWGEEVKNGICPDSGFLIRKIQSYKCLRNGNYRWDGSNANHCDGVRAIIEEE